MKKKSDLLVFVLSLVVFFGCSQGVVEKNVKDVNTKSSDDCNNKNTPPMFTFVHGYTGCYENGEAVMSLIEDRLSESYKNCFSPIKLPNRNSVKKSIKEQGEIVYMQLRQFFLSNKEQLEKEYGKQKIDLVMVAFSQGFQVSQEAVVKLNSDLKLEHLNVKLCGVAPVANGVHVLDIVCNKILSVASLGLGALGSFFVPELKSVYDLLILMSITKVGVNDVCGLQLDLGISIESILRVCFGACYIGLKDSLPRYLSMPLDFMLASNCFAKTFQYGGGVFAKIAKEFRLILGKKLGQQGLLGLGAVDCEDRALSFKRSLDAKQYNLEDNLVIKLKENSEVPSVIIQFLDAENNSFIKCFCKYIYYGFDNDGLLTIENQTSKIDINAKEEVIEGNHLDIHDAKTERNPTGAADVIADKIIQWSFKGAKKQFVELEGEKNLLLDKVEKRGESLVAKISKLLHNFNLFIYDLQKNVDSTKIEIGESRVDLELSVNEVD